jgi:hypothetical protein
MARQPQVFVRSLEPEKAQRLMRITRTDRDRVRLRRAGYATLGMYDETIKERQFRLIWSLKYRPGFCKELFCYRYRARCSTGITNLKTPP